MSMTEDELTPVEQKAPQLYFAGYKYNPRKSEPIVVTEDMEAKYAINRAKAKVRKEEAVKLNTAFLGLINRTIKPEPKYPFNNNIYLPGWNKDKEAFRTLLIKDSALDAIINPNRALKGLSCG